MFNKHRSNNISVPSAPSLDEVWSDIETFQVDVEQSRHKKTTDSPANAKDDWWNVFEQFIEDLKCMEMIHSEIKGCKIKLESLKLEIDTESKLLKNELNQHQQLIDVTLE